MRLSTEQLKTGWLHPRRIVRNAVATHFTDTFTADADVTALAIRAVDEFGWERVLTWDYRFSKLPLADDAALEWVCGAVERTDEAAPSNNLKWHLTTMLTRAEIALVEPAARASAGFWMCCARPRRMATATIPTSG